MTDKTTITLAEVLGIKNKAGDVGIEIEVEALARPLPEILADNKAWIGKPDGSLRNFGMEYVTDGPIKINKSKRDKIEGLCKTIDSPVYNLDKNSNRTSVHVHRNVCSFTPIQVYNNLIAYWLVENALVAYCGPERAGNLFCLRLCDAEGIIRFITTDLAGRQPFHNFRSDRIRYAGQNLKAIPQFGSIEYRMMRGTVDPEIIDTWSNELFNIGESTKQFSCPADMMDRYYDLRDKRDFLFTIFTPDFAQKIVELNPRNLSDMLTENIPALSEVAYYHDWHEWQDGMKPYPTKTKGNEQARFDFAAALAQARAGDARVRAAPIDWNNINPVIVNDPALFPVARDEENPQ